MVSAYQRRKGPAEAAVPLVKKSEQATGSDHLQEQHDTLIQHRDRHLYKALAPNHIRILRLDGIVHIDEPSLDLC